jgi:FKBP-type peptidyl-prolyl cis-trans isomerase
VIETPSGLCYEIVKPGSGRFAKPGDTLKIHYTGRLLSGKVFDRTDVGDTYNVKLRIPPGPWPMPGWYEGLQKINQGGEIELYIPPALAFGDEAYSGAPPYSTLIFDIEVAEIEKTPAAGNK